ncbi:hypothetical protein D3C78_1127690 [compost metagenome]
MLPTKLMSCSTTISECLPARDLKSSAVNSVSASVMPATGSSSSSSCGSCTSSMPISRNCFCPWDSSPAGRLRDSRRRMVVSTSSMRSFCSPLSFAHRLAHTDLSSFCASSRFSNTLRASNTVGFWNLRPMPAWAISTSLMRVRSRVSPKNAVPLSGRVLPVITSISVVLPAPLGPMMQRSSPTPMYSVRSRNALKPSKLTLMSSRVRMVPWRTSSPDPALWPRPMASRPAPLGESGIRKGTALIVPSPCAAGRRFPSADTA